MKFLKDIKLMIYTAHSRFSKLWKPEEVMWSSLSERLRKVTHTGETVAEYRAMTKQERSQVKDIGGFVAGYLKEGRRIKGNVISRSAVTLDADAASSDFIQKLERSSVGKNAWALYSTHSHTKESPRYRLVIPLSREVSPEEYTAIARKLAEMIDIEAMDSTTYEPHRLMYWPSSPLDGDFVFRIGNGDILSPDTILGMYRDWRDTSLYPRGAREIRQEKHEWDGRMKQDPRKIGGLIGAFCRTYTISAAIDQFLQDVYVPGTMKGRYSYKAGESVNGLVLYDDIFAYSHHATDPASGQLLNAFDLVRIHRYGALDAKAKEGTRLDNLPSSRAMLEWIRGDPRVMGEYNGAAASEFNTSEGESSAADWRSRFKMSGGKNPVKLPCAYNFLLILHNDAELKGRIRLDDFAHKAMAFDPLPWTPGQKGSRPWTDSDDSCLRNYISNKYELTSRQVIDDAVTEVMLENSYNPVKDYFNGLQWDGKPRAASLFIDFLGAENIPNYTREVTMIHLLAVIARVMHPGIKYDQCLVLSGPQGIGKSTILRALGRDHYNDSITSFVGKDAMVQLQGSTLIELSEMQASNKAENDQIKAFISRQTDRFRMPYGRRMADFPRTCVFCGTTNDYVFLKDRTGGRRFWPIYCTGKAVKDFRTELTEGYVDQVWAEVKSLYDTMILTDGKVNLCASAETAKVAAEIQMAHTEGSEKIGILKAFLEKELPKNWNEWTDLYDRRRYFENYPKEKPEETVPREVVCTLEIWCECFGNDKRSYTPAAGREYTAILMGLKDWEPIKTNFRFGNLYGRQRGFRRIKINK